MEREFTFEKTVYLTDTNAFGNTYFARYFDWQGMAREEFFRTIAGDYKRFLDARIKFITIEASIKYHSESILFDTVIIKVSPCNVKVTTFELVFTYTNKSTGKLIAEGRQKIGFADAKGDVIPIPEELLKGWEQFKSSP